LKDQGKLRLKLRLFVTFICLLGVACIGGGMLPWRHTDVVQFTCYLILSAVASGWKVELPGFASTLSVSLILFIVSICSMSISETLALGVTAAAIQYCWRAKHFSLLQILFNVSQICIALTAAYCAYAFLTRSVLHDHSLIALLVASAVYFFLNSLPVAIAVALADRVSFATKYRECLWTLPYYLVGAAVGALIQLLNRYAGWEIAVLVMPAVYVIYRSYALYIGRLEDTKEHLEQMASVHLRTVEALALAIDAKDHTTGDHVNRVRVYALELAKDLNATSEETDALRAAAVLHDIGKLAVPEHIISKPGKLTPDEFEKMKVHPIVGAEILEQVDFPYPVVPIVRSHHEKWDGSGYPDGLCGEQIPLGARILAAVDCLDALASDRQYRRALPLPEAMARVEQESGRTFDPRVVAALKARYVELERLAKEQESSSKPKLSVDAKVTRGGAPAAGYAEPASGTDATVDLANLQRVADSGLVIGECTPEELLQDVAMRMRHEVPFDAIAVFAVSGDRISPYFTLGRERGMLADFQGKAGEGFLGWVASSRQAILNGNPTVDVDAPRGLRSAVALPIENKGRSIGIAVLYSAMPDAFSAKHLEVLHAYGNEIRAVMVMHASGNANANGSALRESLAMAAQAR